jgi:esterase/lipase superfamily enzyme
VFRQHDVLQSRALGGSVHVFRYGHFGPPLVVFPSAAGLANEWELGGVVDELSDLLEDGKLKMYCTQSNVAEAWTRREGTDPAWRIGRHRAFESYVMDELVPWIREDCGSREIGIAASGVSLGALYSANFALKFPETFRYALCLSGRYDASWLTEGFQNQDVYFNNPMAYVPNLEGSHLERVRRNTHLALVCGQGQWEDGNIEDTQRLADLLAAKGISHERDLWGHDVAHQWPWWRKQASFHLRKSLA